MPRADRFVWLRRDGAPLAISLALHVAAALLIAPWLVVRTIPAPQVEVEVMLESQTPEPPQRRPERAVRVRNAARLPQPVIRPLASTTPQPRVAETLPVPVDPAPPRVAPAPQPGQGQTGRSAPAPRETAGLSAPQGSVSRAATTMASSGPTALARGSADAGSVAPRAPSLGSTPQPSARPMLLAARAGEDRDDGPLALEGPVSQVQSLQPEFRHAARTGGQESLRGGGRSPEEGLARQSGLPAQTALAAARAVPRSIPGAAGGSGGVAIPSVAAPRPSAAAAAARETAGGGTAALAAAPLAGTGGGSAAASAPPLPGGGRASAGLGSGGRSVSPGETATGLAAAPNAPAGTGSAAAGTGPGAATSGEGRAQQLTGRGSPPREAGGPRLVASGGEAAASAAGGSARHAELSARSESAAAVQPLREARTEALQTHQPTGEARVIEERFTAPALKVASPRSVCELPLLFAGFDRKPIPKGLDTINAAEPMPGETPPRHHPGNQAPRYPLQALGMRAEGRALVRAEVQEDGTVGQIWIKQTSGFQALDLAALETVRGWRFHPAQRHGMVVTMWMDVPIEYKLP